MQPPALLKKQPLNQEKELLQPLELLKCQPPAEPKVEAFAAAGDARVADDAEPR